MINRELMRVLRDDLNGAIAAIGVKHGVLLTVGAGRFDTNEASFKLGVATTDTATAQAVADDPAAARDIRASQDYTTHCKLYGLNPEWLNKQFTQGGRAYKVVGLLPNKRVNNVLVEGSGGGRYIVKPTDVMQAFKK